MAKLESEFILKVKFHGAKRMQFLCFVARLLKVNLEEGDKVVMAICETNPASQKINR